MLKYGVVLTMKMALTERIILHVKMNVYMLFSSSRYVSLLGQ